MQDYKKLLVWAKSHQLTLDIYKVTKTFPKEEMFALTGQIKRACSSIAINIVEGCGRRTIVDKAYFMQIAYSSSQETEYLIFLSFELGFIHKESFETLNNEIVVIKSMFISLLNKIRHK